MGEGEGVRRHTTAETNDTMTPKRNILAPGDGRRKAKPFRVTIRMGTPLWSQAGYDFQLGTYRWLWRAKLAAWWHVQVHPWREATVSYNPPA